MSCLSLGGEAATCNSGGSPALVPISRATCVIDSKGDDAYVSDESGSRL